MKREHLIYAVHILFLILLNGLIFATPYIAFKGDASGLYKAFSYTCHQKISRSECLFSDGSTYWVNDCTPQNGVFVNNEEDRIQTKVIINSGTNAKMEVIGYKIPVCARDVGLYLSMLIAGLVYPFCRKLEDKTVYPTIYLVAAIVPLGIDGTVQLLSELNILPFVYESSNEIRLITGIIAGAAVSVYAISILMNMFGSEVEKKANKRKK